MYEREISKREQRNLIRRAKECDPSAFTEIYEHYYQDIYNYIYYRVTNVQVAEDLAAEVFLKVLESIDSFTFRGIPFSAWLFRVARNLMIDYYRSQPSQPDLPLKEGVLPAGQGPGEILETKLTQRQLTQALSDLTEDQRQVVILKFVNGLSNSEVAQVLGKSEGAVKSLQHRALNSLDRFLED